MSLFGSLAGLNPTANVAEPSAASALAPAGASYGASAQAVSLLPGTTVVDTTPKYNTASSWTFTYGGL